MFASLSFRKGTRPAVTRKLTKNQKRLLAALVLLASALYSWHRDGLPKFGDAGGGNVVKVVDGDTIKVRVGGAVETVRMLGINTPETVDPRRPVQCFGKEASKRMHELLDGATVTLEAAAGREDRDPYGRLLRYVRTASGEDANLLMLQGGFAYAYNVGSPHPRTAEYKDAERAAKAAGRGLWSPKTCNGRK